MPLILRAGAGYVRYKMSDPAAALRGLVDAPPGRTELSPEERRFALKMDAGMRKVRILCLARSVVIVRQLRRRGVAAAVSISVAVADPSSAHAEVTVGGQPLHPHPAGNVVLH